MSMVLKAAAITKRLFVQFLASATGTKRLFVKLLTRTTGTWIGSVSGDQKREQ